MEAKELRIGNFIKNDFDLVVIVFGVRDKEITVSKSDTTLKVGYAPEELLPIPLTEDWLLRFGFEGDGSQVSEEHPWIDYVLNDVVVSLPYFSFNFESTELQIKYVHQLQNLYFALTGTELKC